MVLNEAAYRLSADAVLKGLRSEFETGLSDNEVRRRRQRYGANVLHEAGQRSTLRLILNQFRDPLILILFLASGLAYYLDDLRGSLILLAIILVNAVIGFYQEHKAERLLEELKSLILAHATVLRDGQSREVSEKDLVPGDIVFLEAGAAVPADIRLLKTHGFATNDFSLTGESVPQDKDADLIVSADNPPITDQDNLAFLGTTVARGSATGVVIATGMSSAIGQIARVSQTITRDRSPLQRELDTLARTLTKLAGVIVIFLFAANILLRADSFPDPQSLINASLLFAIGVAAACVPHGLPAQITVALSLGIGRLAKESAVVKRLSAVETLGSTTVICSDKTGTITTNEMTIVRGWANGRSFEVTGEGYDPNGEVLENGEPVPPEELEEIKQFFQHGLLASNGRTHPPDERHSTWYAIGDPTEAAFMPFALKAGIDPEERLAGFPLEVEFPFDSKRKRMTMIRIHKGRTIGYMKGALESVLGACTAIHLHGKAMPLDDDRRNEIAEAAADFSADSLRVIALAYRDFPDGYGRDQLENVECGFVFAGLVAMFDPPRTGVSGAIADVRGAHVRVLMLTGDDPLTAASIAKRIGMPSGRVVTGDTLGVMPDTDLKAVLRETSVIFSRVSPTDKHRIVKLLKELGEVVAVTGDGVNDTLSLKQADIGVAMGKLGSEVAKEAAEIVLIDDDFTTLVNAIREGRTIFKNLRSVILSSITSNIGELSCVCFGFVGAAVGLPIPITAVQILSIDLIGEMLPLMALTFDPAERTAMRRPPRQLGAHIVDRRRLLELVFFGTLMGLSGYVSFYMVLESGAPPEAAQAAAFAGIILAQFVNILSRRSDESVFRSYVFANSHMIGALLLSGIVVVLIVSIPGIALWFGFEPLQAADWIWPVTGALVYLACFEAKKYWDNRFSTVDRASD